MPCASAKLVPHRRGFQALGCRDVKSAAIVRGLLSSASHFWPLSRENHREKQQGQGGSCALINQEGLQQAGFTADFGLGRWFGGADLGAVKHSQKRRHRGKNADT